MTYFWVDLLMLPIPHRLCHITYVTSSQVKSNVVGDAVYNFICKSPEPINMNNTHGKIEQPPVVESRHNLNTSQFEQLLLSPVIEFQAVPAISSIPYG
jgi:hypothetical protein